MFDAQSPGSSSFVSVHPDYLDEQALSSSSDERSLPRLPIPALRNTQPVTTREPLDNASLVPQNEGHTADVDVHDVDSRLSAAWVALCSGASGMLRFATSRANNIIERLLDPHGTESNTDDNMGDAGEGTLSLQVVQMNGTHPLHVDPAFSMNFGGNNFGCNVSGQTDDERGESVGDDDDAEPLRVEIDLPSTLRAYRKDPNECFRHLVAAALSSRSPEDPVTGVELREARLNPYLIRMIIDSKALDLNDELVRSEVQACVDSMIPPEVKRVPQGVYEYLPELFQLPFVRLNPKQYEVLRDSGFEFVTLLCKYPHILPPGRLNSIRLNYVNRAWYIDLLLMLLNILTEVFCIISIVLVTVHWMMVGGDLSYQSYGYYTVTIYGVGYAANLIAMIFLMRGKERDVVYGKMISSFPSPHLHVVPVVPLYNIVSFITYLRYRMARRHGEHVAIVHDILTAQILSSLCFALCLAMPQFIFQRYTNASGLYVPVEIGHHYSYILLYMAVISTCFVALFRMLRVFLTYDSINFFGFACFGFHGNQIIERNSAIIRIVYLSCLFLFELNVFYVVLGSIAVSECRGTAVVTIVLGGIGSCLLLLMFGLLLLWRENAFRIMGLLFPLTALQISLLVYEDTVPAEGCMYLSVGKEGRLFFPDIIWALFFFFLVLLIIQGLFVFVKARLPMFFH